MKYLIGPVALSVLIGCSRPAPEPAVQAAPDSAADTPDASVIVQQQAIAAGKAWAFHEDTDASTKEKLVYATINSLNAIEFGFPYAGAQRATLLYQPRTRSPTIRLIIEHGQILCRSSTNGSNGCYIPVKIDNGGLDIWYAQMASDGRTNVIDFGAPDDDPKGGASCIADELSKTKSLTLRVAFYYEGDRTIDFNVAGLDQLPLPAVALTKKQLEDCHSKRTR